MCGCPAVKFDSCYNLLPSVHSIFNHTVYVTALELNTEIYLFIYQSCTLIAYHLIERCRNKLIKSRN